MGSMSEALPVRFVHGSVDEMIDWTNDQGNARQSGDCGAPFSWHALHLGRLEQFLGAPRDAIDDEARHHDGCQHLPDEDVPAFDGRTFGRRMAD